MNRYDDFDVDAQCLRVAKDSKDFPRLEKEEEEKKEMANKNKDMVSKDKIENVNPPVNVKPKQVL